jgi:aminoglycoside/choline kinase family phosphotransferase
VAWQLASPGVLPPYDDALLSRELALFPDWYLENTVAWCCRTSSARCWTSSFA